MKISTSLKQRNVDFIVDFILNTYGDHQDAEGALTHRLKDKPMSIYVIACLKACVKEAPQQYRKLFQPEENDETLRRWVKGILDEYR